MNIARPGVEQERWLMLADRYPALRPVIEKTGGTGGWKTTTGLGRCLGFLLGLLGVVMFGGVLSPFPSPLLVGGLALMLAAEWLVAQRRVFHSGIEEALYLCGAVGVVVQLLIWIDGSSVSLAIALIASVVLLVGWRLLNPLFTTLAVAGFALAIGIGNANLFDYRLNIWPAFAFCIVIAVTALVAGGRNWQRPAHDRMLDGLIITMPWVAHGWLVALDPRMGLATAWIALAVALGFLAANLAVGLQRRQHAPLIGALGNLVCVSHALFELLRWPLHWKLILAGGALLAVAARLERRLRHLSEGITSRAIAEPEGLDLAQLAGAASIAPATVATPQQGVQGQGGEFGGGGASGRF